LTRARKSRCGVRRPRATGLVSPLVGTRPLVLLLAQRRGYGRWRRMPRAYRWTAGWHRSYVRDGSVSTLAHSCRLGARVCLVEASRDENTAVKHAATVPSLDPHANTSIHNLPLSPTAWSLPLVANRVLFLACNAAPSPIASAARLPCVQAMDTIPRSRDSRDRTSLEAGASRPTSCFLLRAPAKRTSSS